jgi:hypothetical protein
MTPETLAPAIDQKSASNYTDAVLTAIQAALSLFPDDATSNDPTHNVKQQDDTDIDSDDDRAKRPTKRTRRHRSSENTDAATKRRSYRPADFDEAATRPVFTKDARLQLKVCGFDCWTAQFDLLSQHVNCDLAGMVFRASTVPIPDRGGEARAG